MALKVAILGLKGHQGVAVQGISQLPDAELVAVSDSDPALLAGVPSWKCATERTRTYADWRELLEREDIDVVCEAGVDSERSRVIVAAAAKGVHCLTEKPLANSLPELADIRTALEASGIHLSMLLTMRFEPAYRLVREVIAHGAIGDICLATAQKSYRIGNRPEWQRSRQTFSGIIPFIGIHALDLIRWCGGQEFTEVYGACGNTGHPDLGDMEDQGQVLAKLIGGGTASARLDYCRPEKAPTHGDDALRFAGNKGVIEATGCGTRVTLITQDTGLQELQIPAPPGNQFVNFVQSIRGEATCEVPAEDCLRMTEVGLKARASARRGMPYPV